MDSQETIRMSFNDKIVTLKVTEFDTDIDMDDILKIDYSNIIGVSIIYS